MLHGFDVAEHGRFEQLEFSGEIHRATFSTGPTRSQMVRARVSYVSRTGTIVNILHRSLLTQFTRCD
jgi:hypothetical protein